MVDVVSLFAPDGSVWPVFNLADSAIVIGGCLAVLLASRGTPLDRDATTAASEPETAASPESPADR